MGRRRGDGTLSARQQRFVEEYLIDLNAQQAAKRAGYAIERNRACGSDLLAHPDIAREINRRLLLLASELHVDALQLRSFFARIAFDPRQEASGGPSFDQRIAAGREYGKLMGWYTEHHHHTGGLTLEQLLAGADRKEVEERDGETKQ